MTEHTHRQKGRNVARLILDAGWPQGVVSPGGESSDARQIGHPSKNKVRMRSRGVFAVFNQRGETLCQCFIVQSSDCTPNVMGIRDCGLEWSVFTRWHTPRICYTLVTRVPVSNTWTGIRFGSKAKFLTLSLLVLENLDLVAVFLQSYTSDKKCFCEF